jgi:hypothetical protein
MAHYLDLSVNQFHPDSRNNDSVCHVNARAAAMGFSDPDGQFNYASSLANGAYMDFRNARHFVFSSFLHPVN